MTASLQAAAFTPGDLVVSRVGDGTTSLTSAGNLVYLDEYTVAGTLVQSVPMPTAVSGANKGFILTGTGTSEGYLAMSPDKKSFSMAGFASGTASLNATTAANDNRIVAKIGIDASIDTTTAISSGTAGDIRSAVTSGNTFWISGATNGVQTGTIGGTTATAVSTTITNTRNVNIFGGQLYVSDSSGSSIRLGTVGSGTPTTTGNTIANLPGFEVSGSPYGYSFLDESSTVAGVDTLYVADDAAAASGGGIQKWSLDSGVWVLKGTIAATAPRGLFAADNDQGGVSIFATTGSSSAGGGGAIYSFQDLSGYDAFPSGTPAVSTIASLSATSDETFRGIVYVPEPSSVGCGLLLAAGGLMRRRRR